MTMAALPKRKAFNLDLFIISEVILLSSEREAEYHAGRHGPEGVVENSTSGLRAAGRESYRAWLELLKPQ